MLKKEDKIQLIVTGAFAVLAIILCFTALPEKMSLMEGGKVKSNLYLVLLTLLPAAVTFIVAMTEKSRMLSWILLFFIELYGVTVELNHITGFSLDTELLFHGTFLILEVLLAVHLLSIKDVNAKAAFRFAWLERDESFLKVQKISGRFTMILAVAEGINMLLCHYGLYSFSISAIASIIMCYADFLMILRKTKNLE